MENNDGGLIQKDKLELIEPFRARDTSCPKGKKVGVKKIRTIGIDGGVDMEKSIAIDNKEYTIPAIFSYSEKMKKCQQ